MYILRLYYIEHIYIECYSKDCLSPPAKFSQVEIFYIQPLLGRPPSLGKLSMLMILAAKMEDTIGYHRIPQFEVAFFWTKPYLRFSRHCMESAKFAGCPTLQEYSKWSLPLCMSFCWQQNHQEPHCDRTPGANALNPLLPFLRVRFHLETSEKPQKSHG